MQSRQCISCKHFIGGNICKAFDTIPEEVQLGQFVHDKPYPGDNGFRYKISERYKNEKK